jgi:hypothetical protein
MDQKQKKQTNTLITDYFKPKNEQEPKIQIIKGYNPITEHFHCVECGADMGNYQGQLCRKSYCDNQEF